MLNSDPCGGTHPLGTFSILVRTADFMALVLVYCFGALFVWVISRIARDRPMSPQFRKLHPSSSVANYRPISITSVLSKVSERLVSVRLGRFMERSGMVPTTQFAYQKGLVTCGALLCVSHTLQSALDSGQKARTVQIDFSAAFGTVSNSFAQYGAPVVCGIRIQPTFALVRIVRGD